MLAGTFHTNISSSWRCAELTARIDSGEFSVWWRERGWAVGSKASPVLAVNLCLQSRFWAVSSYGELSPAVSLCLGALSASHSSAIELLLLAAQCAQSLPSSALLIAKTSCWVSSLDIFLARMYKTWLMFGPVLALRAAVSWQLGRNGHPWWITELQNHRITES